MIKDELPFPPPTPAKPTDSLDSTPRVIPGEPAPPPIPAKPTDSLDYFGSDPLYLPNSSRSRYMDEGYDARRALDLKQVAEMLLWRRYGSSEPNNDTAPTEESKPQSPQNETKAKKASSKKNSNSFSLSFKIRETNNGFKGVLKIHIADSPEDTETESKKETQEGETSPNPQSKPSEAPKESEGPLK